MEVSEPTAIPRCTTLPVGVLWYNCYYHYKLSENPNGEQNAVVGIFAQKVKFRLDRSLSTLSCQYEYNKI